MSKLYFCASLFDLIEKEFVRRRSYDMQYLRRGSMACLILNNHECIANTIIMKKHEV